MNILYEKEFSKENKFHGNVKIEPGVILGKGNTFCENCVVKRGAVIGDGNYFGPGVIIGAESRERIAGGAIGKKMTTEPKVVIGDNNCFEAYSVIQLSFATMTKISNGSCIGPFSLIGHDVQLEENVIISGHSTIAGYCMLMKGSNIGIGASIHQRTVIGAYAIVGAGGVVVNHILPTVTVVGVPASYLKVNKTGLLRAGFSESQVFEIEKWVNPDISGKEPPIIIQKYYDDFQQAIKKWNRSKPSIPF